MFRGFNDVPSPVQKKKYVEKIKLPQSEVKSTHLFPCASLIDTMVFVSSGCGPFVFPVQILWFLLHWLLEFWNDHMFSPYFILCAISLVISIFVFILYKRIHILYTLIILYKNNIINLYVNNILWWCNLTLKIFCALHLLEKY